MNTAWAPQTTVHDCAPYARHAVTLRDGTVRVNLLVPATFSWNLSTPRSAADAAVPAGYIPQSLPVGVPSIRLPGQPDTDTDGFVHFPASPLPEWSYFQEGPGAPCWVEGAAVGVALAFPDGPTKTLRFTPLCYNTSNLTLCETPLVFQSAESPK
ncbi:MAG: hypothetical protein ACYC3X_10285 [Pirellulaceae bacterium]